LTILLTHQQGTGEKTHMRANRMTTDKCSLLKKDRARVGTPKERWRKTERGSEKQHDIVVAIRRG